MLVGVELPVSRYVLKRSALPHRFVGRSGINVVKRLVFANKKAAVNPSVAGLFLELAYSSVRLDVQSSKAAFGLDGGKGYQLIALCVRVKQFFDVHVAYAVAVCKHKRLASDIFFGL